MTTRDLLDLFIAKREKYFKNCIIEKYDNFIWKKTMTDIENNFAILLDKQTILENYYKDNGLPNIVNDNNNELDGIINTITQLIKFLHKQIDDFGKHIINAKLEEEKIIIKNIQASYLKKLATINKHKNSYLNHFKKQYDLNNLDEEYDIFDYQQVIIDDSQKIEASQYLEDSKTLLTNIIDLNQLFTDVHILVDVQGELLDNIENNIFISSNNVENAHKNLVKTKASADNASSKKCAIFICIIIITIIMIFFVKIFLSLI